MRVEARVGLESGWSEPAPGRPTLEWSSGAPVLVRRWEPEAASWATVVIVHGLGEHSGRYAGLGGWLAGKGVLTTAADLPGHGASGGEPSRVESFASYRAAVRTRVEEARARKPPVALVGHSVGGLVALDYALGDDPPADTLMLSAPALDVQVPWWKRFVARQAGKWLPGLTVPNDIRPEQLSRDPAVGERYLADPLVATRTSARLGLEILEAMERVGSRLKRLSVPTLVVHGDADTIVHPEVSEALTASDHVHRILYPGLRHELFNEPEGVVVAGLLLTWLRELSESDGAS